MFVLFMSIFRLHLKPSSWLKFDKKIQNLEQYIVLTIIPVASTINQ